MIVTYVLATLCVLLCVAVMYLAHQIYRKSRWIGLLEAGVDELHARVAAREHQIACLRSEVAYLADRNNNMRQAVECLEFALNHLDQLPDQAFIARA